MAGRPIAIMGIFVADMAFRTPRLPAWGETVLGAGFQLGPGGKGSNQAVAAARLGGRVSFISKLGRDNFGDMARQMYAEEGIDTQFLCDTDGQATGGAVILIDAAKGDNAIVVFPGSCSHLTIAEIDRARDVIGASAIFMTNLELPVPLVMHALAMARALGVTTILNPAPAVPVPDDIFGLCDYLTPNEGEAAALSAMPVAGPEDAERAADILLARGCGTVILTLGGRGALLKSRTLSRHVPAIEAGALVDTTGAGDAFCGALAVALAEGKDGLAATRFGAATAGIKVTRAGTAWAMPRRAEVDALLAKLG
jgi:ribokinase